jgi:2-(1,2-epoxy-1,2-dihydrophenyl)acetyl-CoA isomerase
MPRILLERDGHVAILILENPDRKNALAGTMREELASHLELLAREEAIGAVVVRGAGDAFCAGTDLERLGRMQADPGGAAELARLLDIGAATVECLLCDVTQPTIAAIRGPAIGAGLGIALACDRRIAADDALLATGFLAVGLHPDWGTSVTLPKRIGAGPALDLLLGSRRLGAAEALAVGLVDEVVPAAEHERTWRERARSWAAAPQPARGATVRSIRAVDRAALRAALARETEAQLAAFTSQASRERVRDLLGRVGRRRS